ncbi:MAG: PLP-dependent transferase [Ferruginibacter sp.]
MESVVFPLDEDFPQYILAKEQMQVACGLISFIKAGTVETIENFCEGLQHFLMAVSWGRHEWLIIPGCTYYSISKKNTPLQIFVKGYLYY